MIDNDKLEVEIKDLELRKKQAEALFMKCEGAIEVLQKLMADDKAVVKKNK